MDHGQTNNCAGWSSDSAMTSWQTQFSLSGLKKLKPAGTLKSETYERVYFSPYKWIQENHENLS